MDVLKVPVGFGVTGHVVSSGEPVLAGDAAKCEFAQTIPGTQPIDESLLAVPLHYGTRVIGAIVISKLGFDQFDQDDLRLLEVLAGHAAVALENARLYEAQRREADSAKALLEFARELATAHGLDDVMTRTVTQAARIIESDRVSLWLQGRRRQAAPARVSRASPRGARCGRDRRGDARVRGAPVGRAEPFMPHPRGVEHAVPRRTARAGGRHARVHRGRDAQRRSRPARAAAPAHRRHRAPGAARDREREQLREPRGHVHLHGRGARERARGERRVHVVARPLDHRHLAEGRRGARPRSRMR